MSYLFTLAKCRLLEVYNIDMSHWESESIWLPTRRRPSGHGWTWEGLRYRYGYVFPSCSLLVLGGTQSWIYNQWLNYFLQKKTSIQSCHGYFCSPWFSPWNAVPSQLREAGCKGIKPTLGNVTRSAGQRIERFSYVSWSQHGLVGHHSICGKLDSWIPMITQNPLFDHSKYVRVQLSFPSHPPPLPPRRFIVSFYQSSTKTIEVRSCSKGNCSSSC